MTGDKPDRTKAETVPPVQGDAIRNLRHELRTPLNHVLGYSQLLLEEAEDTGQADLTSDLARLQTAGKQALAIVNDHLDAAAPTTTDLDLSLLRDKLNVPFDQITSSGSVLRQKASALAQHDMISDLERIDAAARQLLALVSNPTGASQRASDAAEHDEADTNMAPAAQRIGNNGAEHYSLLVVDDNEANRDMLARRLERLGYAVSRADNGRQALAMVAAAKFDLMLLDIMMPELDGYQVLERMKTDDTLRDIPVIVISALDEMSSVIRCIAMGAEDYLPKPFDPVLLRARISACLEKKRLRDHEVEYLRQVAHVTSAAAAVEVSAFEPASLEDVAQRADGLGQLARVFQRMAREVYAREQRLKEQVQELQIEIDRTREARQVAEITETDYFRDLQAKARKLRNRTASDDSPQ